MAEVTEEQDPDLGSAVSGALELSSLQDDLLLHVFAQLASEYSHESYMESPGRAACAFAFVRTTLPLVCKRFSSLLKSPLCPLWQTVIISVSKEVNADKLPLNKRSQELPGLASPLGMSPQGRGFTAHTPMGDSPRNYIPSSPHKGARASISISILRAEQVLTWLQPRARSCRALVLDISNPNHDFSSRTVQQLLSVVRPTIQVLYVSESPGQGRQEGYEVLSTLKHLQHVYIQGIPQDFLQLTMPYLCLLPALRLLHFKPDMSSYPLPARLAQLPTSLHNLHLSKLWLEAFPPPYNKPCSAQQHDDLQPNLVTHSSTAFMHDQVSPLRAPLMHASSASTTMSSSSSRLYSGGSSLSRSSQSLDTTSSSSSASSGRPAPGGLTSALQLTGSPKQAPLHHALCVVHLTECHVSSGVFICLATSHLLELHLHKCTLSEPLQGGLVPPLHSFGTLDLPGPSRLHALTLSACGVKAVLPELLQQLTCLRDLDLSRNEELGSAAHALPHQLSCLVHLTRLDLSSCGLLSVPPAVAALPALHHLNLQLNALSTLPKQLASEGSLQVVDISCNRLTSLPACVLTMSQLKQLVVSSGPVAGTPDFHHLHHRLPCLKLLQVKGATYDCRAVRNLMLLSNSVERARSNLVIDIVV